MKKAIPQKKTSHSQAAAATPSKLREVKLPAQSVHSLSQCTVIKPGFAQQCVIISTNDSKMELAKKVNAFKKILMQKASFFPPPPPLKISLCVFFYPLVCSIKNTDGCLKL